MEFIAKEVEINNSGYNGKHMCLCIHSPDPELMALINGKYPVESNSHKKKRYITLSGKEYRVVAFISKKAKALNNEVFDEKDLVWCDPKPLSDNPEPLYYPLDTYLYIENPKWISSIVLVKRTVERYL